jgi:hypothetical protein
MIPCIIRYQIDPFQRDNSNSMLGPGPDNSALWRPTDWLFFLTKENDVAWGLIAFESLASYEQYRARLKADPKRSRILRWHKKSVDMREERNFVEVVQGTFV